MPPLRCGRPSFPHREAALYTSSFTLDRLPPWRSFSVFPFPCIYGYVDPPFPTPLPVMFVEPSSFFSVPLTYCFETPSLFPYKALPPSVNCSSPIGHPCDRLIQFLRRRRGVSPLLFPSCHRHSSTSGFLHSDSVFGNGVPDQEKVRAPFLPSPCG